MRTKDELFRAAQREVAAYRQQAVMHHRIKPICSRFHGVPLNIIAVNELFYDCGRDRIYST